MAEPTRIHITPFSIVVDGLPVRILEVLKTSLDPEDPWYLVTVQIDYHGVKSRIYTLNIRDTRDLARKLKVEITKIKMLGYVYGEEELRRIIGGT